MQLAGHAPWRLGHDEAMHPHASPFQFQRYQLALARRSPYTSLEPLICTLAGIAGIFCKLSIIVFYFLYIAYFTKYPCNPCMAVGAMSGCGVLPETNNRSDLTRMHGFNRKFLRHPRLFKVTLPLIMYQV